MRRQKNIMLVTMILFAFFCSPYFLQASDAKLPKTMLWSCYDVGASGYIQASSIADAFVKKYGTRIRLTPSGTSIGRIIPVVMKKVDAGFLANEVFCAVEGIYEYSSIEWGPQDLRVVVAHPTSIPVVTSKDSGIKTLKDAKGKRWAVIPGATGQIKYNAILAYIGLTWDDVEIRDFPNYSAGCQSIQQGKADIVLMSSTSKHAYALASHKKGIHYLEFDPNDEQAIARMQKEAPFFSIGKECVGAELSKDNYILEPIYRYPMITVRADADPEFVYNLVKAIDETFSMYKTAYPPNFLWAIESAGVPPADAPFHEGAIRYLKEKGVWKTGYDKWNQKRIEHLEKVRNLWKLCLNSLDEMSLDEKKKYRGKNFAKYWLDFRAKGLKE